MLYSQLNIFIYINIISNLPIKVINGDFQINIKQSINEFSLKKK